MQKASHFIVLNQLKYGWIRLASRTSKLKLFFSVDLALPTPCPISLRTAEEPRGLNRTRKIGQGGLCSLSWLRCLLFKLVWLIWRWFPITVHCLHGARGLGPRAVQRSASWRSHRSSAACAPSLPPPLEVITPSFQSLQIHFSPWSVGAKTSMPSTSETVSLIHPNGSEIRTGSFSPRKFRLQRHV